MAGDAPHFVRPEKKPRLDVAGLVLIAPGVSALIRGLTNAGRAAGFAHLDVVIPLLAGAGLIAAVTVYALRRARPLVDVRLLAGRPVQGWTGRPRDRERPEAAATQVPAASGSGKIGLCRSGCRSLSLTSSPAGR